MYYFIYILTVCGTFYQVKLRREKHKQEARRLQLEEARERVHGRMAAETRRLFPDRPTFVLPTLKPYGVSLFTVTYRSLFSTQIRMRFHLIC